MKPFSLLIKPAGADCNLRCRYCFYLEKGELYPETVRHRMSVETLERVVASFFQTPQGVYGFGWQGGEPTLMGLDFFKHVTAVQSSLGRTGMAVSNGLQTNGTLLDDDWAKHLAKYHFLVGVSVDGPERIHDAMRRNTGGNPTHARVMEGIKALTRHRVDFNILTLASRSNVGHPEKVYDYLCDQGFLFHQYIECVEFDGQGRLQPFAITGREWGEFLCRIFDRWIQKDTRRVSVRLFDTLLMRMVDGACNTCVAGRSCDQYFVVEHNGDIYPCDFNVTPEWRLGNVTAASWEAVQTSQRYVDFAAIKGQWDAACTACPYLGYCHGDCPKNRKGRGMASHLCEGWRQFYAHALPRLEEIAQDIRRERLRQ